MKIKYLFLLISVFFLTACSVDYTLNIDNGFSESIVITPESAEEKNIILNYNERIAIYLEEDLEDIETGDLVGNPETYKYSVLNDRLNVSARYKNFDNYIRSNTFNSCFKKTTYSSDNNSYRLDSDNIFNCFDKYDNFNEITIKFVTTKYVVTHNADSVNGDTYIWTFRKTDPKVKSIIFEYSDKTEKQYKKAVSKSTNNTSKGNNVVKNQNGKYTNNSNEQNVTVKEFAKGNKTLLIILCLLLSFLIIFGIIIFRKKK